MAIKAEIHRLKEWTVGQPLFQYRLVILLGRVFKEMGDRNVNHLAAGVSYYALFSVFPFTLGFLAIAGLVLNSDALYQGFLDFAQESLPGAAGFITDNVDQLVRLSGALGAIAVVGLIWAASAVFGAISRVVNRAWNIYYDGPFYRSQPRQFLMAFVLAFLFLIYASTTSIIELLMAQDLGLPGQDIFLNLGLGGIALQALPGVISLAIFTLIYKLVPRCPTYWRYTWPGALIATILFESSKGLFTWYLANIAAYTQVYGSLASVMIFLFWIYISSLILILGAQICHETARLYHVPGEG